jgi:hypothetical protein
VIGRWRSVDADTDVAELPPLADDETSVRVRDRLSKEQYQAVAELIQERSDVELWIDDHGPDIEMLQFFTGLRRLSVTSLRLQSWDGISHIADTLEELTMGDTLRPASVEAVGGLGRLRVLSLHGPVRHAEVISGLVGLEELRLRSVTLPDLSPLLPMRRLRSLYIGLGGTADVSLLPELPALESLELWRIRGMHDVTAIGRTVTLRELQLQAMSSVTELPSLADLSLLRRLGLETMRGITDLRPVAAAPALEELFLIEMCQLEPSALQPLVGHPTLRRGVWGLCSDRKNAEAWELVPLGDPPWNYERWKARQGRRGPK